MQRGFARKRYRLGNITVLCGAVFAFVQLFVVSPVSVFAQVQPSGLTQGSGASSGRHYPLTQRVSPGKMGHWARVLGKANYAGPQLVRILLPSRGTVRLFGNRSEILERKTPATFGVRVGYTYRLQLSDLPEFPNAKLYPSIEIIDRLHPPAGKAALFPIPIQFTEEEIKMALTGRFVTKVIYLEQPQLAVPKHSPVAIETVEPSENAIAVADQRGRPMVIVRLGGRQLASPEQEAGSYGSGGPISMQYRSPQYRSPQQKSSRYRTVGQRVVR